MAGPSLPPRQATPPARRPRLLAASLVRTPDTKAGTGGREPAPGSLPTLGAAHSPHLGGGGGSRAPLAAPPRPPLPQENAAAGLASCSASCASVPPPPPLRGSVGAAAPGLGRRGGAGAAPPRGRPAPAPADPDPAGAGREVLTVPLPFHPRGPKFRESGDPDLREVLPARAPWASAACF